MKNKILEILNKENFFPSWIGIFVNPFYFARKGLVNSISSLSHQLSGRMIDVGCGSKPYRSLFNVDEYIGLDIDSESSNLRGAADYLYDGKTFPFDDKTFDSALCNQVLEHVFNPDEFLQEIRRVLNDGGKLLLTVPFVWDEHEQPYDYARYSSFGLRALVERNGFNVLEHNKIGADVTILFQMVNAYLYKVTSTWPKYPRLLFTVMVMASVNLTGIMAKWIMPSNQDLFIDHIILVEKK